MGASSNFVLDKRCKRRLNLNLEEDEEEGKEDLFSRFPDEIVVLILSKLCFLEAARTSVLSRRWENMWKCSPGLMFYQDDLEGLKDRDSSASKESRQRFVQKVNRCLELHHIPTVDYFSIGFRMDSSCSSIVNGWLQFAFRKGVQELFLYLGGGGSHQSAFPSAETLKKQLSTLPPTNNLCTGIFNLRIIHLVALDTNQEALEYLLSNSPFLEEFRVLQTNNLVGLNVPCQAHRLKSLVMIVCKGMKRLVVSKSNLELLVFMGPKITLSLENVPLLSQLSIGLEHCEIFLQRLSLHSSLLSQLKKLTLEMSEEIVKKSVFLPLEVPTFSNLEHLEVFIGTDGGVCLLWPTILVKAAPFLRKLSVEFVFECYKVKLGAPKSAKIRNLTYEINRRRLEEAAKETHPHLKVVELKHVLGSRNQLELAQHLLSIAGSLDKLVLNVAKSVSRDVLENLAAEMREKLPSGAELVVRR